MKRQRLRTSLRWPSLRDKLSTSLWLAPVAYTLSAMVLAFILVWLDHQGSFRLAAWLAYRGSAEGARAVLSTIASSMLTIAGLVFSISILVLQLASSQFSPRVLRTFLQDAVTQRTMGMLLGSFMYPMMVLPTVRSEGDSAAFIPGLAVFGALAWVLLSVGSFIQYIHHMAHSIRAVSGSSVWPKRRAACWSASIQTRRTERPSRSCSHLAALRASCCPTPSALAVISLDEEALMAAHVGGPAQYRVARAQGLLRA